MAVHCPKVAPKGAERSGVAHDDEAVVAAAAPAELDEGGQHSGIEGISVLAPRELEKLLLLPPAPPTWPSSVDLVVRQPGPDTHLALAQAGDANGFGQVKSRRQSLCRLRRAAEVGAGDSGEPSVLEVVSQPANRLPTG